MYIKLMTSSREVLDQILYNYLFTEANSGSQALKRCQPYPFHANMNFLLYFKNLEKLVAVG